MGVPKIVPEEIKEPMRTLFETIAMKETGTQFELNSTEKEKIKQDWRIFKDQGGRNLKPPVFANWPS